MNNMSDTTTTVEILKRLERLESIDEIKKLKQDIRFLLAGYCYERDQLSHLAEKYEILNQTLFFINYLPKDQMPGLLSAATVTTSFFVDFP